MIEVTVFAPLNRMSLHDPGQCVSHAINPIQSHSRKTELANILQKCLHFHHLVNRIILLMATKLYCTFTCSIRLE